jgi:hypothetical protein
MPQDKRTTAAKVRENVAKKNLPIELPMTTSIGCGRGKPCHGCGDAIVSHQIEYLVRTHNAQTFRLHGGCHGLWLGELIRLGAWKPEPPQRSSGSPREVS